MKLLKKMIAVAVIVTAGNAVMAQDAQQMHREQLTPEQRADKGVERMNKELSLTDAQRTKLKAVLLDKMQKRDAAMAKVKEDRKEMHSEMKTENDESDKEISTILDATQLAKYNKMKEKRKAKMEERRKGGKDGNAQPAPPTSPRPNE